MQYARILGAAVVLGAVGVLLVVVRVLIAVRVKCIGVPGLRVSDKLVF